MIFCLFVFCYDNDQINQSTGLRAKVCAGIVFAFVERQFWPLILALATQYEVI